MSVKKTDDAVDVATCTTTVTYLRDSKKALSVYVSLHVVPRRVMSLATREVAPGVFADYRRTDNKLVGLEFTKFDHTLDELDALARKLELPALFLVRTARWVK